MKKSGFEVVKEKWRNWRVISNYTSQQKGRLVQLQKLYSHFIKLKANEKEGVANKFLETDEDGVPVRNINTADMNLFDRYLDAGPLVSYANMIQTKVLQYLQTRRVKAACYANDVNSLFCMQLLNDFQSMLVTERISDELLERIDGWLLLIKQLQALSISQKNEIFTVNEERNLPVSIVWLLMNISNILEQSKAEVVLELNCRTISDHLKILTHRTKVYIELMFEYLAYSPTHVELPLDFNIACFYDTFADLETHKQLYQKTWFRGLYNFAASDEIRQLFFATKPVNHLLLKLMGNNDSTPAKSITFVDNAGKPDEQWLVQLKPDVKNRKGQKHLRESGLNDSFAQSPQLAQSIQVMGRLQSMARLATLMRMASYILHHDGALVAREDTKTQLTLFLEMYQNLLNTMQGFVLAMDKTLKMQTQQSLQSKEKTQQNPNLGLVISLDICLKNLYTLLNKTVGVIQGKLVEVEKDRSELDEFITMFKQQWFGFVNNHIWMLTGPQQATLKELRDNERKLALNAGAVIMIEANSEQLPKLLLDQHTPLSLSLIQQLLKSAHQESRNVVDVMILPNNSLYQKRGSLDVRLSRLQPGQRLVCLIDAANDKKSSEDQYPTLLVITCQGEKFNAIYVDCCGRQSEQTQIVDAFCEARDIKCRFVTDTYAAPEDVVVHLYHQARLLVSCEDDQFNSRWLYKQLLGHGHKNKDVVQLLRYDCARLYVEWHNSCARKKYSVIQMDKNLAVTKLRFDEATYITRDACVHYLERFPDLTLVLTSSCRAFKAEDYHWLLSGYSKRCEVYASMKKAGEPLHCSGNKWIKKPQIVMMECIVSGITNKDILEGVVLAIRAHKKRTMKELFHKGDNFLHFAVRKCHFKIIPVLIKGGVDKQAKNEAGMTALDLAVSKVGDRKPTDVEVKLLKSLLHFEVSGSDETLKQVEVLLNPSYAGVSKITL